jgi:hypothetical protein
VAIPHQGGASQDANRNPEGGATPRAWSVKSIAEPEIRLQSARRADATRGGKLMRIKYLSEAAGEMPAEGRLPERLSGRDYHTL